MIKIPKHIYIVDDDNEYRKSLMRLLRARGYHSEGFSSAQTFLDSVPVDYKTGILILDLRMPGLDGFGLQKKLNEFRSNLRVIFITADVNPGDRDYAFKNGAMGFLQKPFNDESIFELIQRTAEAIEESE